MISYRHEFKNDCIRFGRLVTVRNQLSARVVNPFSSLIRFGSFSVRKEIILKCRGKLTRQRHGANSLLKSEEGTRRGINAAPLSNKRATTRTGGSSSFSSSCPHPRGEFNHEQRNWQIYSRATRAPKMDCFRPAAAKNTNRRNERELGECLWSCVYANDGEPRVRHWPTQAF